MLLNLEGFTVLRTQDVEDAMCITVETDFEPTTCIRCSTLMGRFYGHGTKKQFFHDAPIHGKKVLLTIHRKRYKCRDCGGVFDEHDVHLQVRIYLPMSCCWIVHAGSPLDLAIAAFAFSLAQLLHAHFSPRLSWCVYTSIIGSMRRSSASRSSFAAASRYALAWLSSALYVQLFRAVMMHFTPSTLA